MALPAFQNLKDHIKGYFTNEYSHLSVAISAREILDFAYDQVRSSEEIARKLVLTSTSRLDLEIRVAVQKLHGEIRSLRAMTSRDNNGYERLDFPRNQLEALKRDVMSFDGMLKKMAAESPVSGEDDDAIAAVSSKMVGLSDQYEQLKDRVNRRRRQVMVVLGMPGIGKTALARKVFDDPDTVTRYDCRVWVTVGRKCKIKEIPRRILAAVNPDAGGDQNLDDEEIARCLKKCLNGKRFLIVLDDVWNQYMASHFSHYCEWNKFEDIFESDTFPGDGLVVITTRIQQLDMDDGDFRDYVLKMRLLNNEESWDLLREKVFGEEKSCPPHLEEDGKKIAENCEGLPLTILTVADLLSKQEKKPKYWRDVALGFVDRKHSIEDVIESHVPNHFSSCFFTNRMDLETRNGFETCDSINNFKSGH